MSEDSSAVPQGILPIAIEQGILDGKGLTQGDMGEFEDEDNITQGEDGSAGFSTHMFHTGKIMVSVYEAEPGKVHIDGPTVAGNSSSRRVSPWWCQKGTRADGICLRNTGS